MQPVSTIVSQFEAQVPFSPDPRVVNDPHIDATVDVRPFVSDTPEPTTLWLAALGLVTACGPRLYRHIRRRWNPAGARLDIFRSLGFVSLSPAPRQLRASGRRSDDWGRGER